MVSNARGANARAEHSPPHILRKNALCLIYFTHHSPQWRNICPSFDFWNENRQMNVINSNLPVKYLLSQQRDSSMATSAILHFGWLVSGAPTFEIWHHSLILIVG